MSTPEKNAILIVSPHDHDIDEAVRVWQEEHNYNVITHVINDLKDTRRDMERTISKYSSIPRWLNDPRPTEKVPPPSSSYVRAIFTECAYGSLSAFDRFMLINGLYVDPRVRWVHLSKQKDDP